MNLCRIEYWTCTILANSITYFVNASHVEFINYVPGDMEPSEWLWHNMLHDLGDLEMELFVDIQYSGGEYYSVLSN